MRGFVARRLLGLVPLLFGISVVIFALIHTAPGGPTAVYALGPDFTREQQAAIERSLGLDRPLAVRYLAWVGGMLRGSWGHSYKDGRDVRDVVLERVPATLTLMGTAYAVSLAVAIPVGVFTATRPRSPARYVVNVLTLLGISVPTFWTGLLAIMCFSVWLGLMPSGGMYTIGAPFSLLDRLRHLALPALVLAAVNLAMWARYVHSSLIEVLQEDYIRTARAKGLGERVVVFRHALRNTLLVVVTLLGLSLPGLFSGALVTEAIFSWSGNGRLIIESLLGRNYPVLIADFMILAALAVLGNLAADIAYAFVDPRIRFEARG
ncbi:MAG: ABC transporter permease [Armatimonadota bacterium]|nr:ABC transporter permease [Armatimonadota bacterium]